MDYKELNSLHDIIVLSKSTMTDDGESISFELKGTAHRENLDSGDKNRLAKEISAFANTYGGIICFHFGKDGHDQDIEPFPGHSTGIIYRSLEGWLFNSIEPQLRGLDLVLVEGVFVINVPESEIKPHRSAREKKEYYYRHGTQSRPMPEIMISSMYRSQRVFSYTPSVSANFYDEGFRFTVNIKNDSTLSGSVPKFELYVFLSKKGMGFTIQDNDYFDTASQYSLTGHQASLKLSPCVFRTNTEYSSKLLYPKDKETILLFGKQRHMLEGSDYVLVQLDTYYRESSPKHIVRLYDVKNNKLVSCSRQSTKEFVTNKFLELIAEAL